MNVVASEVAWNTLTIYDMGPSYSAYLSNEQSANIEFHAESFGAGVKLSAVKWNYAEICNAWMLAEVGVLVDETFVKDAAGYFHMNNIYGNGQCRTDYDILIPNDESVYLAFAYANWKTPTEVNFGWAEISFAEDGQLQVVRSATDLSGNSMIVGFDSIPEPSSGLLLLLGIAGLALRRKRAVHRGSRLGYDGHLRALRVSRP